MKKGLSILLVGVMVTSLFGCSFNEPKEQVKTYNCGSRKFGKRV